MDPAKELIRITARAFYSTEHVLIIDALAIHSTLNDIDLAHILGMQLKGLRRLVGRLKEDGLISVESRGEKKEGAPPMTTLGKDGQPTSIKERLFYRDWYYLNYHRAIDSIKYRMMKLSKYIESQGAPTTEKKDLVCPRCKSQYTELEVMDNISPMGDFLCHMCQHSLDPATEDDTGENENMKRLNDQLSRIVDIMRNIDSTDVPENDFDTALSHALPIDRGSSNPARRIEIVESKPSIASTKGLSTAPDQISVSVMEDGDGVKIDPEELARRREKEAKQNMLPEWISKSTISGDITSVGAKEAAERASRDAHNMGLRVEDVAEDKKLRTDDDGAMDSYWAALKAEQERQAQQDQDEEEEEEDDDDDEFEDVDVGTASAQPASVPAISVSTPATSAQVSSTATDEDGPAAKRTKVTEAQSNGTAPAAAASSQAAAAESKNGESDEDEDELEFEDI
uniref:Transcription factor efuD n=1 Tax=Hormonema carpetanum TaxID=284138 RepID=EFUD_HORCR|nr:RecName: Full=Transcription factor efuD; AltName: Full=Enfumafungin biosynthesis cluster protein D [Hormonema carpetanum]AWW17213.1 transcription initiation factor [Hormonema carpetanum]